MNTTISSARSRPQITACMASAIELYNQFIDDFANDDFYKWAASESIPPRSFVSADINYSVKINKLTDGMAWLEFSFFDRDIETSFFLTGIDPREPYFKISFRTKITKGGKQQ